MAKLSRKEKYQDLRNSLEQESEPQVTTKQVRSSRMAAPDFKADQKMRGPVIEDLLGEVKQYNLDNGELVTDDTQMQILHDLSSQEQAARRSVHFETMEQNEDFGGTTRNLYSSDLSSLMANNQANSHRSNPKKGNQTVKSTQSTRTQQVQSEEPDFLDLFTPRQNQESEEPIVEVVEEEKTKEKPVLFGNPRRKRRKVQRSSQSQMVESQDTFEKTIDTQSLDSLFSTTQVQVEDSYFIDQDDGPEVPFSNRNQQVSYQEPVYEEEYIEEEEEEKPSGRLASLIRKVHQRTQVEEDEEEESFQEEPPIVVSKKNKKASTPQSKRSDQSSKQSKSSKTKQSSKSSKPAQAQSSEQVSSTAIIFMVVCCVILLLLILLTIFWMSKLGIF